MKLDLETRLQDQDSDTLRLWLRFMTCSHLLTSTLRSRFKEHFDITVPRFDLLVQLEKHPQGLGAQELARRLMVTPGNITVVADPLEKEGLLERTPSKEDRRSVHLILTPQGRDLIRDMNQAYESWLQELFAGLDADEQQQFLRLLSKLKGSLLDPSGL